MKKFVVYLTVIAAVMGLCALGNVGVALAGGNYHIEVGVGIIAVSLLVLFVCAIYNFVQYNKTKQERCVYCCNDD